MNTRRLLSLTSPRRRRFIAGVSLVAYVVCVVGFPVPLAARHDDSIPFPCQHHACGCNSAAECWDNCCCFTPAERLAWAREHGVTIPAAAARRLAEEAAEETEAPRSCCAAKHAAPKPAGPDSVCPHCSDDARCDDHESCGTSAAESLPRVRWINAIQAQKCQGLTTFWLTSGANLPLAIKPLWQFDWTLAGTTLPAAADDELHLTTPPVRPPRG